jgi:protein TonB
VIRIFIAIFLGTTIALGLFWGMQYMIANNQQDLKETDNLRMTEFVRLKRDTKMQVKERQIPDKPKPKERPKQPKMQMHTAQVTKTVIPDMDMPNLDVPLQLNGFKGSALSGLSVKAGKAKISTNVMPLVRIPPRYPIRAANRRIQGWVKLEFTITKEGTVTDAIVVDAKPSSIFNRAALKAIKRWRFKPQIIAGEAYEQRAMQTLEFKLSR